jgi:uncharacterized protein (TIGR01777 family)
MKTVIAGGSGFLGRALARVLVSAGHDLVILTRGPAAAPSSAAPSTPLTKGSSTSLRASRSVTWIPDGKAGAWARELDGASAVVNLAGESIAARRWSAAQKARIRDSRVLATRSLTTAIRAAAVPPGVFISGSAVGYYGPHGDELVTEDTPPGHDFLASVAAQWEAEATAVASITRLVLIRTGIVLDRHEGALPKMLPPFWLGAGGPVGSGRQFWPWIHKDDWVDLVRFAIQTPAVSGPLNATAPAPVTNAEFAATLGRVLRRPAFLPTPGLALKVLLGEMAEALLLTGQRAVPARAERLGAVFTYRHLDEALRAIFPR